MDRQAARDAHPAPTPNRTGRASAAAQVRRLPSLLPPGVPDVHNGRLLGLLERAADQRPRHCRLQPHCCPRGRAQLAPPPPAEGRPAYCARWNFTHAGAPSSRARAAPRCASSVAAPRASECLLPAACGGEVTSSEEPLAVHRCSASARSRPVNLGRGTAAAAAAAGEAAAAAAAAAFGGAALPPTSSGRRWRRRRRGVKYLAARWQEGGAWLAGQGRQGVCPRESMSSPTGGGLRGSSRLGLASVERKSICL